jgi:hypothetical protein
MHKYLVCGMYGWLTFAGTMHLIIDVISGYVRGKRPAGPETTLFYGMHTAYGLGQMFVGLLGLIVARHATQVFEQWPALAFGIGAATAWLVFAFIFIEYWEPKLIAGLFLALAIASAVVTKHQQPI